MFQALAGLLNENHGRKRIWRQSASGMFPARDVRIIRVFLEMVGWTAMPVQSIQPFVSVNGK